MALLSWLLWLPTVELLSNRNRICLLALLLLPRPKAFLNFFMILQEKSKLETRDVWITTMMLLLSLIIYLLSDLSKYAHGMEYEGEGEWNFSSWEVRVLVNE